MDIILTLAMFASLMGLLMLGYPVAFTLGGTGLLFGVIGLATGTLDLGFLTILPNRVYENIVRNELLFAVPLFVAMGVALEKSKVAEDLLESMGRLFGGLRGGLGISVTLVGALLAASTGIVGATVVTMGLLSLPTMLRRGYDPKLATGSIAAAGTLGQIIPPSIVLILLADVLSNAWSEAQRAKGNFAPDPMSAGELFAGALMPGLMLVGLYIIYQIIIAAVKPAASPAVTHAEGEEPLRLNQLLGALIPPLGLIIAVLGSILTGIATPTEAASVGAIGAILLGAYRLAPEVRRSVFIGLMAIFILFGIAMTGYTRTGTATAWGVGLTLIALFLWGAISALTALHRRTVLMETMQSTVRVSSMIYGILVGAALFSLVFRGIGGDEVIEHLLTSLPGGTVGALVAVMLLMFVLGFFLDFIEITFVVVPVVAPTLLAMDGIHGPIWLGVLIAMNLQTSFLTPPFGFALFYLRGVAPASVTTSEIYKGALPFVLIQALALVIIAVYPELVLWLPELMFD